MEVGKLEKITLFYSHVNYSVTKILCLVYLLLFPFYSHVNYSVTKINVGYISFAVSFTVT